MSRAVVRRSPFEESRSSRLAKRALLLFIVGQIPIGALSSYRAWVQIKELSITTPSQSLRAGSPVRADLVSWARTEADARLELVQGTHAETLGEVYLRRNHEPVYDPRPRRGSVVTILSPALLARFEPGPARLRATALGRPQWLRTPPPTVRERNVVIERAR